MKVIFARLYINREKLHFYRRTCIFVHLKQTEPPRQSACHRTRLRYALGRLAPPLAGHSFHAAATLCVFICVAAAAHAAKMATANTVGVRACSLQLYTFELFAREIRSLRRFIALVFFIITKYGSDEQIVEQIFVFLIVNSKLNTRAFTLTKDFSAVCHHVNAPISTE